MAVDNEDLMEGYGKKIQERKFEHANELLQWFITKMKTWGYELKEENGQLTLKEIANG